jgi:eukaryotic-like serine/threonine-protein kinase
VAKLAAEVGSTANRYQILERIAVGGMAEIFLARGANATGFERYCVLKRILRERANDDQFVQMFIDEARLAAQLQHPSIASVYDIGMLGDSYFFTMEYVHGETVKSLVQRAQELRRPLPLACVLTIVAGTAAGLHHAHERNGNDGRPLGIVHRDISPANLMVSYEGNLKIVDFGVAKAADRAVETQSGMVKGKISYLSPEQCRGARVDRRSDLFSLGIVMWEMLTGARLYRRANDFESMTAIVREPPPPPSSRRPEVPRAIDDLVLRLLAKSVTERFQTAPDVVEAIENASLRARTILSASAVSQLVRDLFGARAEPWLEYESETLPFQPCMIASRPLPKDLGRTLRDPVERDLVAVPGLTISGMFEEVLTDGSLSALDVEPLEPDACPPVAMTTVPGSRAARANAPHAVPSSPLPGVPIIAPSPGPSPTGVAPVAAQGSQPVRITDLAARSAAPPVVSLHPAAANPAALPARPSPADIGPAKLLEAISAPSRPPVALPSAVTLRGVPPGGAAGMAIADLSVTTAPISRPAKAAGLVLTTGPSITALDLSPAGATATEPFDPVAAGPSAVTTRDAALAPTLVAPPIASALAPTWIPSWSPARATPPTPFEALPAADSGPAPGQPVALPPQHPPPASSPTAAPRPQRSARPPSAPVPHPARHAAPSPVPPPQPVHRAPASNASGITTAKWRPTRELALRVAPRLFTVIIPAATVGAILAWLVTHDEPPPAPTIHPDHAPAATETRPPPATEAPPAGAPGDEKADAAGVAPGADRPAPAPGSAPHPSPSDDPGVIPDHREPDAHSGPPSVAGESTPASRPDTEADRRRSPSKPNASAHTAAKPGTANNDPYAQIKLMYEQRNYPAVVRACHAFIVRSDVVPACFDAACHQQNVEEARRWLALIPAGSRNARIAACKQTGHIDVSLHEAAEPAKRNASGV